MFLPFVRMRPFVGVTRKTTPQAAHQIRSLSDPQIASECLWDRCRDKNQQNSIFSLRCSLFFVVDVHGFYGCEAQPRVAVRRGRMTFVLRSRRAWPGGSCRDGAIPVDWSHAAATHRNWSDGFLPWISFRPEAVVGEEYIGLRLRRWAAGNHKLTRLTAMKAGGCWKQ